MSDFSGVSLLRVPELAQRWSKRLQDPVTQAPPGAYSPATLSI